MDQSDNNDFTRAFFGARNRMNKMYTDESPRNASTQERSADRREVAERRQTVPWVVDSNDRRSGIDRRTGLDRRGNRVPA